MNIYKRHHRITLSVLEFKFSGKMLQQTKIEESTKIY